MINCSRIKQRVFLCSFLAVLSLAVLAGCSRSDSAIADDVAEALAAYPDVTATLNNKQVILNGEVKSHVEQSKVVALAQNVEGITSVKDNLVVEPGPGEVEKYIDDTTITAVIKGKHLAQEGLESLDISVKTVEGVVTLSGAVNSEAQAVLAEKVANEAEGVKRVVNNLTLKN